MVTFNFTFDPGTTVQQMVGFEMAGRVWSSYLTDNVTLNIQVGVASSSSMPTGVIGGALPSMQTSQSYQEVYNNLAKDQKTTDDAIAVSNLNPTTDKVWFDKFVNGTNQGVVLANNSMSLTQANAKAMGYSLGNGSTALDGYIRFSNLSGTAVTWNYDYTRSTAAGLNTLDFLGTAIHEIGHVLGFVSGIDKPGWLNNSFTTAEAANSSLMSAFNASLSNRAAMSTPLDLFRDTNNSQVKTSLTQRDMSYGSQGGDKAFTLDKGQTSLGYFSTGADTVLGGDGEQASHWKSGGIMAPTLKPGQRPTVSGLDLRAYDVIGWDVAAGGINTKIDLSALQNSAKQSLAIRSNQSVNWINNNLTFSPTQLVQDRSTDIQAILAKSQFYDISRPTPPTPPPIPLGIIAIIDEFMDQLGLFSRIDELDLVNPESSLSQSIQELLSTADVSAAGLPVGVQSGKTDAAPVSSGRAFQANFDTAPIQIIPTNGSVNTELDNLATFKQIAAVDFNTGGSGHSSGSRKYSRRYDDSQKSVGNDKSAHSYSSLTEDFLSTESLNLFL